MATCKIVVQKKNGKPRPNKDGFVKVYIQYVHRSYKFLHPTGVYVTPQQWKGEQDQPINSKHPDFRKLNRNIKKQKRKIEDLAWDMAADGAYPTIEAVQERLQASKPVQQPAELNLVALFDEYIEKYCRLQNNQALNTIRNKRLAYNRLTEYLENRNTAVLTPDKVTLGLYNDFVEWLRISEGMNDNSIGSIIKNLVVFLRYIEDTTRTKFADLKKFKVLHDEYKDPVYLEQDELSQLEKCDYTNLDQATQFSAKQLDEVRDLFVFVSRSGLRVSDLLRLAEHHIKQDTIQMKAHKTGKSIYVPLVPQTKAILRKYDYRLPRIAAPTYNKRIKEACRLAGITALMEVTKLVNNRKVHTTLPKWQLISSHRAISTFITHALEADISLNNISLITGKTKKVILSRYVGGSKKTAVKQMQRAFGSNMNIS